MTPDMQYRHGGMQSLALLKRYSRALPAVLVLSEDTAESKATEHAVVGVVNPVLAPRRQSRVGRMPSCTYISRFSYPGDFHTLRCGGHRNSLPLHNVMDRQKRPRRLSALGNILNQLLAYLL